MKKTLKFNNISDSDWPQILQIEQQIYPNPWPLKTMQDCVTAGYQCIKGSIENKADEVACYAFMMIGFEESNLLNISVNPTYQRQSLASQMLHRLMLISRINHAKQMWLEVRESNVAAIRLYEKHDFVPIGKRRNYYKYTNQAGQKIKEHAIVMAAKIK